VWDSEEWPTGRGRGLSLLFPAFLAVCVWSLSRSLGCVRLVISMPKRMEFQPRAMAKKRRTPPAVVNRLENASEMFLLAATGFPSRFFFRRQLPRRPRHPSWRHAEGWGPERHGPTY
jgi:hypothetical protein